MAVFDINDLPSKQRIFIDTNIFSLHFQGRSAACTTFFRRVAAGEIIGYVNTEVLSDLLHQLMMAEAVQKNLIGGKKSYLLRGVLERDRTMINSLPDHQSQFEVVLSMGIRVLPISKKLLIMSKKERKDFGLMTNDSLHLSQMDYHSKPILHIASYDGDFVHVPHIDVWKPNDIINGL